MKHDEQPSSPRRTLNRLARTVLTYRRMPFMAAVVAVVLVLPALRVGWIGDDDWHRLTILGSERFEVFFDAPMEMFRFFDGDQERTWRGMDVGLAPWWTYEGIKGWFWRPVTVLTHRLDYGLWPQRPALMHVQSFMWFGGLVLVVAVLYRRFLGAGYVAGLAALLFAMDDAHSLPAGWLANRNALLATFFGVCAVLVHDRWRSRPGGRWQAGVAVGPLLLLISLLSAEGGIATCAYLIAYELFLDRSTWRQRCLVLLPYGGVVVVWRLIWAHLGYGVASLGLYVDPISEPFRFVAACIQRAPAYLLGQWAVPPPEVGILFGPGGKLLLWLVGLAFLLLLAVTLMPLLRQDRVARFWVAGMVLSIVPICAVFSADRLMLFVGIGAMGLLAQFLSTTFGKSAETPAHSVRRIVNRGLAYVFIVVHLVIAPITLPIRAAYPMGPKDSIEGYFVHVPSDASVEERDVVMVNPIAPVGAGYLPIIRELNGRPVPRHTRALAPGWFSVSVYRIDERTLVIRPAYGFIISPLDDLVRDDRNPMFLGQRVELTGMTVEVTALTDDARPAEAVFQFAVALEDPSLVWLQFKHGALVPFKPPAVGETIELPAGVPAFLTKLAAWGRT